MILGAFPDTDPHGAVVKHVHRHLLFVLIVLVNRNSAGVLGVPVRLFDKPLEPLRFVELQEYGCTAGVALDLHTQDAVTRPLLTYMLQAVNG